MARWTSLKDIMFDYDKTSIRPSEMSKTSDIATYMNQNPSARLGIDGSTDLLRGTNQYNVAPSQQRISNVRDALIQAGVSTDRMETGGFGVARIKCSDSPEVCSQPSGRCLAFMDAPPSTTWPDGSRPDTSPSSPRRPALSRRPTRPRSDLRALP